MKKLLQIFPLLFGALFLLTFTGCGPSEEEKAKMEQEASQAVDSMMKALESEMQTGTDSLPEPAHEDQTTTKESEEAPKQ